MFRISGGVSAARGWRFPAFQAMSEQPPFTLESFPCGSIPRLHQAAKTAAQYLVAWATTSYRRHQCRFAASLGLLRLVRPASLLMLVKSTSAIRRKLFLGSRFRSFCDCMPWLEAIVAQARIPTVGFCACPCSLAQGDVIQ